MIFISPGKKIDLSYEGGGGSRILKELYIADSNKQFIPFDGCDYGVTSIGKNNKFLLLYKLFNEFFLVRTLYKNYKYALRKSKEHGRKTVLTDDIHFAFAFKKAGWRVILTYHGVGNPLAEKYNFNSFGLFSIYPLSYLLYKRIHSFCDLVIFPSEGGMLKYISSIKSFEVRKILPKTVFITNGIADPLQQLKPDQYLKLPIIKTISGTVINNLEDSILCVARIISDKGIDILIESFSLFMKTSANVRCNLIIVGTGPDEIVIRKQISALNLDNSVCIVEKLTKNQILFCVQKCKFFAVTPRQTVCDLVFLEVMSLGKNILTSAIPGNLFMFKGTQVIMKQLNVNAIAEGINEAINQKQHYFEKNRNSYLEFHSIKKMYDSYIYHIASHNCAQSN